MEIRQHAFATELRPEEGSCCDWISVVPLWNRVRIRSHVSAPEKKVDSGKAVHRRGRGGEKRWSDGDLTEYSDDLIVQHV